jgi:hypothetical protein
MALDRKIRSLLYKQLNQTIKEQGDEDSDQPLPLDEAFNIIRDCLDHRAVPSLESGETLANDLLVLTSEAAIKSMKFKVAHDAAHLYFLKGKWLQ